MLSFAGRLLLVKRLLFSIQNYWVQCFPMPKKIMHKIDSICRIFLWTYKDSPSKKSPVRSNIVCTPRNQGDLNLINILDWNRATMIKNVWDLSGKLDSLWIRWIHVYYLKGQNIMEITVQNNISWMMKYILKQRMLIVEKDMWNNVLRKNHVKTRDIYHELL